MVPLFFHFCKKGLCFIIIRDTITISINEILLQRFS